MLLYRRPRRSALGRALRRLLRRVRRISARRLACSVGRHEPRRGRARWRDGAWRTRCKNCGTPMVRLRKRQWIVDEGAASDG